MQKKTFLVRALFSFDLSQVLPQCSVYVSVSARTRLLQLGGDLRMLRYSEFPKHAESAKFQGLYLYGPHLATGPALNVYTTCQLCSLSCVYASGP